MSQQADIPVHEDAIHIVAVRAIQSVQVFLYRYHPHDYVTSARRPVSPARPWYGSPRTLRNEYCARSWVREMWYPSSPHPARSLTVADGNSHTKRAPAARASDGTP